MADSNSDSERRFGLGAALQSESGPRNAPVKNLSLPFLRFPLCLSPHSLPCLAWKRPTEHSFRAVFATVHYFAAIHTFPEALADGARVGVQGRGSGRRPPPHDSPCASASAGAPVSTRKLERVRDSEERSDNAKDATGPTRQRRALVVKMRPICSHRKWSSSKTYEIIYEFVLDRFSYDM